MGRTESWDYIAANEWEFGWTNEQIQIVDEAYHQYDNLLDIANKVNRDSHEVLVLLIDLIRKGKIKASGKKMFKMLRLK